MPDQPVGLGGALNAPNPLTSQPGANPVLHPSLAPNAVDPSLQQSSDDGQFKLQGDVHVFGREDLTAKFYSWDGPLPAGVMPGLVPAVYDKAVLDEDFHLSLVIPQLANTPFDKIIFRNVEFIYQNYPFDSTLALGWHLEADWVIDESCGNLHDVLRTVLGVNEPTLHVHAGLGLGQDWSSPLKFSSFTIDGTFVGIQAKICDELTLTQIGVQIFGVPRFEVAPQPHTVTDYAFGIFGEMNLKVPGQVLPLELDFQIREMGGAVSLAADVKGNLWRNALGVNGLILSNVSFSASLALKSPMSSFNFDVSATLSIRTTSLVFVGSYAAGGGGFTVEATIENFEIRDVSNIYEAINRSMLNLPEVDIKVGMATVSVSSTGGFSLSFSQVQVEDYAAADASITFNSSGASLRGDITSADKLSFGDVDLTKAYIQMSFTKNGTFKSTDFIIGGEVKIESLTIDAAVHVYKSDGPLQWTVYAELSEPGSTWSLAHLEPKLAGSFLDLPLNQVTFVAASQDDPSMQAFGGSSLPFTFHQGVQFCAVLGEIDPLKQLLNTPAGASSGLTLSAGWSKTTGFSLDITTATPLVVHMPHKLTTDPFTLRVQTSDTGPTLTLFAGLDLPVAHTTTPLHFTLSVNITPDQADFVGQMQGWWVDPFGIGQDVKVGPTMGLGLGVTFVPPGVGDIYVSGGLAIGSTAATLALSIDEDPLKELLSVTLQNLDIIDVVDFIKTCTRLPIPQPPDFLQFNSVNVYICPAGTTIGQISYPPGFNFSADMTILGHNASIAASIGTSGGKFNGSLQNFELGPLKVQGLDGAPNATVDIEVGLSTQHFDVNGSAYFFDIGEGISVDVTVMPSPIFKWKSTLHFTSLLTFDLNAELVGAPNWKSIKDADFILDALMKQEILSYVAEHVKLAFDAAKQASDEGIEAAQQKVDAAKADMQAKINAAKSDLDKKAAVWSAKQAEVQRDDQAFIDTYNRQFALLQDQLTQAKGNFDRKMQAAEQKLQSANADRAGKMRDAQAKVTTADNDMKSKIAGAQNNLTNAENKMNREFGNAENDINAKRRSVDDLQNQINSKQHEYDSYGKLNPKRIKSGIQLAALKTAKATADAGLTIAEKVVQGGGYVSDKAGIAAAQDTLKLAQTTGQAGLTAAQGTLHETDVATQAAVNDAQKGVNDVQHGTDYAAFQTASKGLTDYQTGSAKVLQASQAAVAGLQNCAEAVAYKTAQTALDAANHATNSVDVANAALTVSRDADDGVLDAAKWALEHGLDAINIQTIHVTGSLRGIIGLTGKVEKPLTVHIDGLFLSKPFSLDATLDTRKFADFVTTIFKHLYDDLQADLKAGIKRL